jgi:hypothetical protein
MASRVDVVKLADDANPLALELSPSQLALVPVSMKPPTFQLKFVAVH